MMYVLNIYGDIRHVCTRFSWQMLLCTLQPDPLDSLWYHFDDGVVCMLMMKDGSVKKYKQNWYDMV